MLRMVMQAWMATPDELARNPALREFAESSYRQLGAMDNSEMLQKFVSQFPGLGDGLVTQLKEFEESRSVNLRTHMEMFAPLLKVLAAHYLCE